MNSPEGGLYRPLVWSVALFLVASGVLLTIQMISSVVGPFRVADIGATDPRTVVALWRPTDAVAGALAKGALGHELVQSGRSVREIGAIGAISPGQVGVIVLSEPRGMDPQEVEALRRYVESGGGAVVVGSIAVRDAGGAWRGYDAMNELLGADVIPQDGARAIVASRRGPLSSALAPRQRVAVAAEPGLPGIAIADAELRWDGDRSLAASARREIGRGRLAWIAVGPERADVSETERTQLRQVLEAAVAWASRTAWIEVLPWPQGKSFAGVVERASGTPTAKKSWQRAIDSARPDAAVVQLRVASDGARGDGWADALAAIQRAGGWTATRKELTDWTLTRSSIDASVRRAGPRRLLVELTNRSRSDADGLVLRLHLNERAGEARAESTKLMQEAPQLRSARDAESIDLVLPRLAARTSFAYSVDYAPAEGMDP